MIYNKFKALDAKTFREESTETVSQLSAESLECHLERLRCTATAF